MKSSSDNYESFQLLNYKKDKKYFEGKFNSTTILLDSWGEIFIECLEEGHHSDLSWPFLIYTLVHHQPRSFIHFSNSVTSGS